MDSLADKTTRMQYHIQNEHLSAGISSLGAEIRSLKDRQSGEEFIWQINPEVWGSSAPVLFPAIGSLKDGYVLHKGEKYALPKHGIIRNNQDLKFQQISDSECSFSLESSPATAKLYPFEFRFRVSYKLEGRRLIMEYHIENLGDELMPFICGGHTAYALPLKDGFRLNDYQVQFPTPAESIEALTLAESGLLGSRKRNFPLEKGALVLNQDIFKEDALIFANVNCEEVILKKPGQQSDLRIVFKGYPHLALWAKPGADYVCIEPWLGLPDREEEPTDLSEKSTYRFLEAGNSFSIAISTEVI